MQTYSESFIDYLIHFQATRDYFECHEIMEEYWLENDRDKKWLTLIQLAVAVYHERQKNRKGSLRLYRKVLSHLDETPGMLTELAIDEVVVINEVKRRIQINLENGPFENFDLPITDPNLEKQCQTKAIKMNAKWLSHPEDIDLMYKHKLRDRSDVIEAREQSKELKQKERGR